VSNSLHIPFGSAKFLENPSPKKVPK